MRHLKNVNFGPKITENWDLENHIMNFQNSFRMAFAKAMHRVNSMGISISEISTVFLSEKSLFQVKI